ncbi:MAG TPA: 3-isopropylmalate dehydratase large subunit [bacterium]|nr:3-isopropylmalate dehydratase large subunit [bacterium]
MKQTIAEKILSAHAGKPVKAGEIVLAEVDFLMAQDGTAPLVIKAFESLNPGRMARPQRVALVIDHNSPSPSQGVSALHALMRDFAAKWGLRLFDIGEGICHVLVPESGFVSCGSLILGADSHTPTYGALNAMACGVGSTDLAIALMTGRSWFRVPATVRVTCQNSLREGVYAKDLALAIVKRLTAQGAIYRSVEIQGQAISALSMDGRFTICNLMAEVGAKCAVMTADETTLAWLKEHGASPGNPVVGDDGAEYEKEVVIEAGTLPPQIARPHAVDNVVDVTEVAGLPIQQAFIGTCTNGRVEDLAVAAKILTRRKISPGVRLICTPGSRRILLECLRKGYLETLISAGACVTNPGCGPCVGTHQGIPAYGEVVISTANRNFKGRMGNQNASIYLASPATVAASAITGVITDPREFV